MGVLLVVQAAVVVRDALALGLAAREGARAAAVSADDARVAYAVRRSSGPLDAGRIVVAVSPAAQDRRRGEPVTVRLDYEEQIRVPIVDRIVDATLPLSASATMRLERASPTPAPTPTPTPAPTPGPAPP